MTVALSRKVSSEDPAWRMENVAEYLFIIREKTMETNSRGLDDEYGDESEPNDAG